MFVWLCETMLCLSMGLGGAGSYTEASAQPIILATSPQTLSMSPHHSYLHCVCNTLPPSLFVVCTSEAAYSFIAPRGTPSRRPPRSIAPCSQPYPRATQQRQMEDRTRCEMLRSRSGSPCGVRGTAIRAIIFLAMTKLRDVETCLKISRV